LNTAFILLPDFILILAAWGINRYTSLNASVWESIEKLVFWILFPALLFSSAYHANLDLTHYLPMLLLLAGCMTLMGLLSYSARWLFAPDPVNLVSGIQTTIRFNTFLVLAVAGRILAPADLEMMVIAVACLVPFSNTLAIYSLTIGTRNNVLPQLIKNPFVLGTLLGLTCNLLEIEVPEIVTSNLSRLGAASIPLGLMTVGASLKWTKGRKDTSLVLYWTTLKLLVLPAAVLLGAYLLHLPANQKANAVLFASMPTATSAYVLTNRMGGNGAIVAVTISIMTLLAAVTVPIWIYLLHIGI
jgi:hypothetical protein